MAGGKSFIAYVKDATGYQNLCAARSQPSRALEVGQPEGLILRPAGWLPEVRYADPSERPMFNILRSIRTLSLLDERNPQKRKGHFHFPSLEELAPYARDAKRMIAARGMEGDLKRREPSDHPEVWQMIAAGEARGVHHIESPAMCTLERTVNINNVDDLIAIVSLCTPISLLLDSRCNKFFPCSGDRLLYPTFTFACTVEKCALIWCFSIAMIEDKSTTIRVVPACPREFQKYGKIAEGTPLLFSSDWEVLAGPTRFVCQIGQEYGASLNTAKAYADVLRTFLSAFVEESWDWQTASYDEILAFRAYLIRKKLSPRTINHRMVVLSSFYRWALFNGYVANNPIPETGLPGRRNPLKVATGEIPPRAIPMEDLRAICAQLSIKYRLATQLSLLSGMRQCEVARLTLDQLPESAGEPSPFAHINLMRKGAKPGFVAVPTRFVDTLYQYSDYGERREIVERRTKKVRGYREPKELFLTDYGLPLVSKRLSKEFRTAVLKAGLQKKKYTYHGVRHTFAITWLRELRTRNALSAAKGYPEVNDLGTLQLLMGHKHRSTTEIYLTSLRLDEAVLSDSLTHLFDGLISTD
jgi:site-specific recombinase XerD